MATAGSRVPNSTDPLAFGAGDDGEWALERDRFWSPEERIDRLGTMPPSPKGRRRRGTRVSRNGKPQRDIDTTPADHAIHVDRTVHEPFDVGPLTGNPALAEYELMEALASAAARTDDDAQAARLVAALVPLALRLVPDVATTLWPVLPDLLPAVAHVAELLRRRPANRPLLGLLPMLLRRTLAELRQRIRDGQPVTGTLAAQMLTQQATTVFNLRRSTHTADGTDDASSTI